MPVPGKPVGSPQSPATNPKWPMWTHSPAATPVASTTTTVYPPMMLMGVGA